MKRADLIAMLRRARLSDTEIAAVLARHSVLVGDAKRIEFLARKTDTPLDVEIERYRRSYPGHGKGRVGRIGGR